MSFFRVYVQCESSAYRLHSDPACDNVGNYVLSCYPTSDTVVNQGDWTKFICTFSLSAPADLCSHHYPGNARYPEFIGIPGQVDIYLYNADSDELVNQWKGVPNVQSQISVRVNDSFWDDRSSQWQPGQKLPFTYYFVVTKAGHTLTGGEQHQATWTAMRKYFYFSQPARLGLLTSSRSTRNTTRRCYY